MQVMCCKLCACMRSCIVQQDTGLLHCRESHCIVWVSNALYCTAWASDALYRESLHCMASNALLLHSLLYIAMPRSFITVGWHHVEFDITI